MEEETMQVSNANEKLINWKKLNIKPVTPAKWTKNVAKSLGLSIIESVEGIMSTPKDFKEANNELFKEIYSTVKEPGPFLKSVVKNKYVTKVIEAVNVLFNGIVEDAISGNLYNTERDSQMGEDAAMAMMGDTFGDMNYDDDFESSVKSSNEDMNEAEDDFNEAKHDDQHTEQVETTKEVGRSVTDAVYNSTKYMGQMSEIGINAMQKGFSDTMASLTAGFSKTSLSLESIGKVLNEQAVTHFQNSYKYYEESVKTQKEISAALNEILGYQRNLYKQEEQKHSDTAYDKIVSNGVPNLKEYFKYMGKNIVSNIPFFDLILGDSMGEGVNLLATLVSSPYKLALPMIFDNIMSTRLKASMESFDETLKNLFANFSDSAKRYSSNYKNNPILRKVVEQFVIKEESPGIDINDKGKITGLYAKVNKNPMQFNGIAQTAITSVIPEYLARIEAAITGSEQRIFDYNTGVWKTKRVIEQELKNTLYSAVTSQTSRADYRASSIIDSMIEKQNSALTADHKQVYELIKSDITQMLLRLEGGYDNSRYNDYLKYVENICVVYNKSLPGRKIDKVEAKALLDIVLSDKRFIKTLATARRNFKTALKRRRDDDAGGTIDSIVNNSGYMSAGTPLVYYGGAPVGNESSPAIKSRLSTIEDYENVFDNTKGSFKNNRFLTSTSTPDLEERIFTRDKEGEVFVDEDGNPLVINNDLSRAASRLTVAEDIKKFSFEYDERQKMDYGKSQTKKQLENVKREIESRENTGISDQDLDDLKKKRKDLEEKLKDEEERKKNLKKMDLFEKLELFKNKITDIIQAPSDAMAEVIEKADTKLFNLFFDREIEVEDSKGNKKTVNGFVDYLVAKTENSFSKFGDWFSETFLGKKTEKKLDEVKESVLNSAFVGQYKDAFRAYASSISANFKKDQDIIKKRAENAAKLMKKQDEEKDKEDPTKTKEWYNWIHGGQSAYDSYYNSKRRKEIEDNNGFTTDPARFLEWLRTNIYTPKNDDPEKEPEIGTSAHGRFPITKSIISPGEIIGRNIDLDSYVFSKVKRLGIYGLGPDDIVIPNSKYQQKIDLMREKRYLRKIKKNYKTFGEGSDESDLDAAADKIIKDSIDAKSKEEDFKDAIEKSKGFSMEKLLDNSFFRRIGVSISGKSEEEVSEALIKAGSAAPSILINTIGKGLVGALFGFPILSAIGGATAGIIKNSTSLSEKLFGKATATDEDGNVTERDDTGYVPKWLQEFFKKTVPDLRIFGAGGAVAGLLFPQIGIPAGMLIGGATALLKNNEGVNKYLFGELVDTGEVDKDGNPIKERDNSGIISNKLQKFFKESLPNVVPASLIGLVFNGPFGPVGGMLLGAGVGMLMKTETFGDLILGKKDPNDKTGKKRLKGTGLLGALYKVTVKPLATLVKDICKDTMEFLKNDIAEPIKNFLSPLSDTIKNTVSDIGLFIKANVEDFLYSYIGMPMEIWTETFAGNITKLAVNVIKGVTTPVKTLTKLPFKALGGIGNLMRASQIRRGRASGMTAQERIDWAKEHKSQGNAFDVKLANMTDEEISNLNKGMNAISLRGDYSQRYIDAANEIKFKFTNWLQTTESTLHPGKSLMDAMGSIIGIFGGKKNARLIEYFASNNDNQSIIKIRQELNKMVSAKKITVEESNAIIEKLIPMMQEVREGIGINIEHREGALNTLKLFTNKIYNNNTSFGRFLNKKKLSNISALISKEAESREKLKKDKDKLKDEMDNNYEYQAQIKGNETRETISNQLSSIIQSIKLLLNKEGINTNNIVDPGLKSEEGLQLKGEIAGNVMRGIFTSADSKNKIIANNIRKIVRCLKALEKMGYITFNSSSAEVLFNTFKSYNIDYESIDMARKDKDINAEINILEKIANGAQTSKNAGRTYNDNLALYEELKVNNKNLVDMIFNKSYKDFTLYIKHLKRSRKGIFGLSSLGRTIFKAAPVYTVRGIGNGIKNIASGLSNNLKIRANEGHNYFVYKEELNDNNKKIDDEIKKLNKELKELDNKYYRDEITIEELDTIYNYREKINRLNSLKKQKQKNLNNFKEKTKSAKTFSKVAGAVFGTYMTDEGTFKFGNILKEGFIGKAYDSINQKLTDKVDNFKEVQRLENEKKANKSEIQKLYSKKHALNKLLREKKINPIEYASRIQDIDAQINRTKSRVETLNDNIKTENKKIGNDVRFLSMIFGTKQLENGKVAIGNIFKEGFIGKAWRGLFGDPNADNEADRKPLFSRILTKLSDPDKHPIASKILNVGKLIGKVAIAIPVIGHLSNFVKDKVKPFITETVWPGIKKFFGNIWDNGEGGGLKYILPNLKDSLIGFERYDSVTKQKTYVGGVLSPIANIFSQFKYWWDHESNIGRFFNILFKKEQDQDGNGGFWPALKFGFGKIFEWYKDGWVSVVNNLLTPTADWLSEHGPIHALSIKLAGWLGKSDEKESKSGENNFEQSIQLISTAIKNGKLDQLKNSGAIDGFDSLVSLIENGDISISNDGTISTNKYIYWNESMGRYYSSDIKNSKIGTQVANSNSNVVKDGYTLNEYAQFYNMDTATLNKYISMIEVTQSKKFAYNAIRGLYYYNKKLSEAGCDFKLFYYAVMHKYINFGGVILKNISNNYSDYYIVSISNPTLNSSVKTVYCYINDSVSHNRGPFTVSITTGKVTYGNQNTINEINSREEQKILTEQSSTGSGRNSHIYQNDPRISNMTFGKASTIGEAGCGPVAVTNMANSLGHNMSLGNATRQALMYQDSTGGTTTDYIGSALRSTGIKTYDTENSNNLRSALKRGNSAVLLGQDYADGAYGSNNHYINALGYDKSGKNIIVEDPDLPQSRVMYPEKQVLNNMKHATIAGKRRNRFSGMGKYNFKDKDSEDYKTLKARTIKLLNDHEGGYTSINPNDNGGFAFGILQFHSGYGYPASVVLNRIKNNLLKLNTTEGDRLAKIAEKYYNKSQNRESLNEEETAEFTAFLQNSIVSPINIEAQDWQASILVDGYLRYPLRLYNDNILKNPKSIILAARAAGAGQKWIDWWSSVYDRYNRVANGEPGYRTYEEYGLPIGLKDISLYKAQENEDQELINVNNSLASNDSYLGNTVNKLLNEYETRDFINEPVFWEGDFSDRNIKSGNIAGWKTNLFGTTFNDIAAWNFDNAKEAKEYNNSLSAKTNTMDAGKITSAGYVNNDSLSSGNNTLSKILSAFSNAFTSMMDVIFGSNNNTTETVGSAETVEETESGYGRYKDVYNKLSPENKYKSIVNNASMINRIDPSAIKSPNLKVQLAKFKSLSKTKLGLDTTISRPNMTAQVSTIHNSNGTTSYNVQSGTGRYSGTGNDEYIAILNVIVGILSTIANNSADISLILDFLVEQNKLSGKAREDIEKRLKERKERTSLPPETRAALSKINNSEKLSTSLNTDIDGLLTNNENLRSIMNVLAKGI